MIEAVPQTFAIAVYEDALEQRDQARRFAVRLEQERARAVVLLEALTVAVADLGSAELWQHPAVSQALFFIADMAEVAE